MNLTLRQLRAFVAVAEHKQFTAAAKQVHLSQAALSIQIRDLEEELGFKLFDRHTRMVKLTDQGAELLGTVHRVLEEIDNAIRHSKEYLHFKRGNVRVTAGTVISSGLLVPFMQKFMTEFPDVNVQLIDMAEQTLLSNLKQENIDFAVGTPYGDSDELIRTPLFTDEFQLLLTPSHPLNREEEIGWEQLNDYPFIALFPESPIRQEIDLHFLKHGVTPQKVFEVSFHTTVLSMVRNGLGVAVLPSNSRLLPEAEGIVYRELRGERLVRATCLFELKYRSLSPVANLFKARLVEYVSEIRAHYS